MFNTVTNSRRKISISRIPSFPMFNNSCVYYVFLRTLYCCYCYLHICPADSHPCSHRRESGMERNVDASLLVVNAHKGKGKTEDLLISNYSTLPPELLKKLLRLYSQDFRFFGYDPRDILEKIYPGRKDVLDSLMSVL